MWEIGDVVESSGFPAVIVVLGTFFCQCITECSVSDETIPPEINQKIESGSKIKYQERQTINPS